MKKRIISFIIFVSIVSCLLPFTGRTGVWAAALSTAAESLGDFEKYGDGEAYALVPLCAGNSSVEEVGSKGEIKINRTFRTKSQSWYLAAVGEYYYIQNAATNKVIGVPGNKAESGSALTSGAYAGRDGQLWLLDTTDDGCYVVRSKLNTDLVMDISGADTDDGTAVILSDCHKTGSQRFRLVHVSATEPVTAWGASRSDVSSYDPDVWNGIVDTGWYYANKKASVYAIESAGQLAGLAKLVLGGICDFDGKTILLDRDISLGQIEWVPIGTESVPFKGSFNGQDHSITGLLITRQNDMSGLFGCVDGGCVTNFALKGSVSGNFRSGGVVGRMIAGHVVNVYSEVILTGADNDAGGICGWLGEGGYIEHCTQNAEVTADNGKENRGGIAGYSHGGIRYCENLSAVTTGSERTGGILGAAVSGGLLEYCSNYGEVSCKKWAGGICGLADDESLIFGCANYGSVRCQGNDGGGILGERKSDAMVYACMNTGAVYADKYSGGIVGDGKCSYSFNAGQVDGGSNVGAVSGRASALSWCRALSWTSKILQGDGDNNGAQWVSAEDVISGKCCYELNRKDNALDLGGYGPGWKTVFYQNIGGDAMPSYTGQTVSLSSGKYMNESFEVRVICPKNSGTVTGGGIYKAGERVTLTAEPMEGYKFGGFKVELAGSDAREMYNGSHAYPSGKITEYMTQTVDLTEHIDSSYTVRVIFEADGNQAGEWDTGLPGQSDVGYLNEDGTMEVTKQFTDPKEAISYAENLEGNPCIRLKGVWELEAELALSGGEITLDLCGYPIRRSLDGMTNNGGVIRIGRGAVLHIIDSAPDHRSCDLFTGGSLEGGRNKNGGGLIHVEGSLTMEGGTLYNGGTAADGGAIHVSGGTIELSGTLIANCFSDTDSSDNNGGALNIVNDSTAVLSDCTIRSCTAREKGGAVHMNGSRSSFEAVNTVIAACWAENKEGGAIFQDDGCVSLTDCTISNCQAADNDAGAIFQNEGPLYCANTAFASNTARDKGGAVHINTDDRTWLRSCTFAGNQCGDKGGAIYLEDNYLYMEDCNVTGNASANAGGGIYLDDDGSIDLCGVMVVMNNDGKGTMDNLVMEKGAYIYDQGLMRGSEVHVRSTGDGKVALSRDDDYALIDEFQVRNYFVSDANGLALDNTEESEVGLTASAFTTGTVFTVAAGCAVIVILLCICLMAVSRRWKNKA